MEKQLNSDQERLQTLIEKGSFNSLSPEEQAFVGQHTTQVEFDRLHELLVESKHVYDIPEPAALVIPAGGRRPVLAILVPISSAAAAVILTLIFFRQEKVVFREVEKTVYTAADTVYVHDTEIDTIIQVVREHRNDRPSQKQIVPVAVELNEQGIPVPDQQGISSVDLQNRGENAASDKTIALIDQIGF